MPDDYLLVQFRLPSGPATLTVAADRLGIPAAGLDPDYGVVEVDPADRLFVARVALAFGDKVSEVLRPGAPVEGIFGDVRIEPMGPGGEGSVP